MDRQHPAEGGASSFTSRRRASAASTFRDRSSRRTSHGTRPAYRCAGCRRRAGRHRRTGRRRPRCGGSGRWGRPDLLHGLVRGVKIRYRFLSLSFIAEVRWIGSHHRCVVLLPHFVNANVYWLCQHDLVLRSSAPDGFLPHRILAGELELERFPRMCFPGGTHPAGSAGTSCRCCWCTQLGPRGWRPILHGDSSPGHHQTAQWRASERRPASRASRRFEWWMMTSNRLPCGRSLLRTCRTLRPSSSRPSPGRPAGGAGRHSAECVPCRASRAAPGSRCEGRK